ncbi:MAG: hypothetical protein QXO15_05320 [Nitrososphaerota archaeon]
MDKLEKEWIVRNPKNKLVFKAKLYRKPDGSHYVKYERVNE